MFLQSLVVDWDVCYLFILVVWNVSKAAIKYYTLSCWATQSAPKRRERRKNALRGKRKTFNQYTTCCKFPDHGNSSRCKLVSWFECAWCVVCMGSLIYNITSREIRPRHEWYSLVTWICLVHFALSSIESMRSQPSCIFIGPFLHCTDPLSNLFTHLANASRYEWFIKYK